MFKKFLLALSISCLILPSAVLAQSVNSVVPEFNPLCWKRDACAQQRATIMGISPKDKAALDGWYEEEAPCAAKGWGKCLPAGETVTEISFGGQRKFRDIGQLILVIYNYALSVGGIIAVIVIFVAGLQWITSGGNAEGITSAKKRIGGAIMGLFLLFMSYFMLDAVNPALVNLRLPRIWLLKPASMVPQFCSQAPSTTVFAWAAKPEEQDKILSATNTGGLAFDLTVSGLPKFSTGTPILNKAWQSKTFYCGTRFYIKDGGTATCFGDVCEPSSGCAAFGDTPKRLYVCKEGAAISGKIYSSNPASPGCLPTALGGGSSGYYYPYINNNYGIVKVCQGTNAAGSMVIYPESISGTSVEIKDNEAKKIQTYVVKINKEALDGACKSAIYNSPSFIAYGVEFELDDHTCGVDASQWLFGKNGAVLSEISSGLIVRRDELSGLSSNALFSKDELLKGNATMDIDVSSIPDPQ